VGSAWAAAFILLALAAKSFLLSLPNILSPRKTREVQQTNTQVSISKSKRRKDTNVRFYSPWGKLLTYEGGRIKNHLQVGEEVAHFLAPLWHALQASGTLEGRFLGPV